MDGVETMNGMRRPLPPGEVFSIITEVVPGQTVHLFIEDGAGKRPWTVLSKRPIESGVVAQWLEWTGPREWTPRRTKNPDGFTLWTPVESESWIEVYLDRRRLCRRYSRHATTIGFMPAGSKFLALWEKWLGK